MKAALAISFPTPRSGGELDQGEGQKTGTAVCGCPSTPVPEAWLRHDSLARKRGEAESVRLNGGRGGGR